MYHLPLFWRMLQIKWKLKKRHLPVIITNLPLTWFFELGIHGSHFPLVILFTFAKEIYSTPHSLLKYTLLLSQITHIRGKLNWQDKKGLPEVVAMTAVDNNGWLHLRDKRKDWFPYSFLNYWVLLNQYIIRIFMPLYYVTTAFSQSGSTTVFSFTFLYPAGFFPSCPQIRRHNATECQKLRHFDPKKKKKMPCILLFYFLDFVAGLQLFKLPRVLQDWSGVTSRI